jgi:tetratricopeptide (TPR) repeat protein
MKPTGLVLSLFVIIGEGFAATPGGPEAALEESQTQAEACLQAGKIGDAISILSGGVRGARERGYYGSYLAGALTDLGTLYQDTDRPADAGRVYTEAIRILKSQGDSKQVLMTALKNFGRLRVAQGRSTEAERLYQEAEQVALSLSDGPVEALAGIWSGLADIYIGAGRYREAGELAERAVSLLETNGQPAKAGAPLFLLASIAWHKRDAEETERFLRRAIAAWEEYLGADHPTYAAALGCLAAILSRTRPDEAEQLFRKSLDTLETKPGGKPIVFAGVLMLYSQHLKSHGHKTEGKDIERRAELVYARHGLRDRAGQTVDIMMLQR